MRDVIVISHIRVRSSKGRRGKEWKVDMAWDLTVKHGIRVSEVSCNVLMYTLCRKRKDTRNVFKQNQDKFGRLETFLRRRQCGAVTEMHHQADITEDHVSSSRRVKTRLTGHIISFFYPSRKARDSFDATSY
jgi:hypothetical protein